MRSDILNCKQANGDVKYNDQHKAEDAGDKLEAEAKAVANKVNDPDKDLTEYEKEKVKEKAKDVIN
jgi:hypothetical protein